VDIQVETQIFEQRLADYSQASGRAIGEVLVQQARLVAKNVIQRTPPFVSFSGMESFAVQRRAGEGAVRNDIESGFASIDRLPELITRSPRLKSQMEDAVKARDEGKIRDLMTVAKLPASRLIDAPTTRYHNVLRDRRGRVRRRKPFFWVTDRRALQRFVREKQKLVGRAKAGWGASARTLGVRGLPQWILRHPEQGRVVDRAGAAVNPYISMTNTVSYIGTIEQHVQMVPQAIRGQSIKMEAQIRAKLRGLWGKRGGLRQAA
jgi:hypothetical protein